MVNRQWRACNLSRQICVVLSSKRFTYVKRSRVHYFLVMMIYVRPISEPERSLVCKLLCGDRLRYIYKVSRQMDYGYKCSQKKKQQAGKGNRVCRDGVVLYSPPTQNLARVRATSQLLVLYSALRGFCPGSSVFPSPQKSTFSHSNSIGCRTSLKTTFG